VNARSKNKTGLRSLTRIFEATKESSHIVSREYNTCGIKISVQIKKGYKNDKFYGT
jgi:hypothetical protein